MQNMVLPLTGDIKRDLPRDDDYERRILWLRSLMEWRQDVEDAREFVDSMKTDVFQDRVYVFTPRETSLTCRLARRRSISLITCIRISDIAAEAPK